MASLKSFMRKDAPPRRPTIRAIRQADFHGERRGNATHRQMTDLDARLCRKAKGQEAKLAYQGHVLMANRHGLAVEGAGDRLR